MLNKKDEDAIKDVDFTGLILGFSSAALYYIGAMEPSEGEHIEKNLPLAKQNIHIIELLLEKTKGNLSAEEKSLIERVLKDLNVKFKEAEKENKA